MKTSHMLINGDCRRMSLIKDGSVQLIVTSPPYWQLKDYGMDAQIGFNDTYEQYINNLNVVWYECHRVLEDGCRLCVNIGDQFARSVYYGRYKVIPIHSEIIRFCEEVGFDYMGSIVWQKPTNMHTTGGQKVMGSYPYPRGGIVKIDFEHILLFKKQGKVKSVEKSKREASKITDDEWNTYFSSHWNFSGAKQDGHIAVFPEELPKRLIKMFSFVEDTVLDPFMGSGTTALAAMNLGRNSIGYEINDSYSKYYTDKVVSIASEDCEFQFKRDETKLDINKLTECLPYRFVDVHKLDKQVYVKAQTYGSVIEDKNQERNVNVAAIIQSELIASQPLPIDDTVLLNHARRNLRELMIKNGICYLRAGASKGSVLVTPGFERLQYVVLHTAGKNCQMFRLKNKCKFQIWSKDTLLQYGFNPQNADYYAVLHFDGTKPIDIVKYANIEDGMNTYRARIKSIKEFEIRK